MPDGLIAIFTLEFPPIYGGISTYVKNIARILGEKCVIITGEEADYNDQGGPYKILRFKLLYKFIWPKWAKLIFIALSIRRKYYPKIFFTPNVLPIGYVFLIYKLIFGVQYIINLHGLDIKYAQANWWKRFWFNKIINNSRIVIINSEYTKKLVMETVRNLRPKLLVLYPCPDIVPKAKDDEMLEYKNKLGINNKIVMLSFGRLVKRKGVHRVLGIMPDLIKKIPDLIYIIAGSGPELENIGNMVHELKLQNFVRLLGPITDYERGIIYSLTNFLVMPSGYDQDDVEGFGIVYTEAALFGVPSIAANVGGCTEAVIHNKTGIIISNNDELKSAIIHLAQDSQLSAELGKNAFEFVRDNFVWEKQVSKLTAELNL